jgi:hypothetical protein
LDGWQYAQVMRVIGNVMRINHSIEGCLGVMAPFTLQVCA